MALGDGELALGGAEVALGALGERWVALGGVGWALGALGGRWVLFEALGGDDEVRRAPPARSRAMTVLGSNVVDVEGGRAS